MGIISHYCMNRLCKACSSILKPRNKLYCNRKCKVKDTCHDVPESVRQEYEAGYALKYIARKYGVGPQRIENKIIELGGTIDNSKSRRFNPSREKLSQYSIESIKTMLIENDNKISKTAKIIGIAPFRLTEYCNANNIDTIIPTTKPTCHPDREHHARGLCDICYDRFLYRRDADKYTKKHLEWSRKNREHLAKYRKKHKAKDPLSYVLGSIKKRAKDNNYEFNLTVEDLREKWTDICPVFNIKMYFHSVRQDNSFSVDRIDSSRGYTKDNICIISCRANQLKSNGTIEELEKVLIYMKKYSK